MPAESAPSPEADRESFQKAVPAPLRRDLVVNTQHYLGKTYAVLKNPLDLSYFRLPLAHYTAASMLDGKTSVLELSRKLRSSDRYWRFLSEQQACEELKSLAEQLSLNGLISLSGHQAYLRVSSLRKQRAQWRPERLLFSWFYIKKSLFDPDRLLKAMHPWLAWVFTPAAAAAFVVLLGATALMLAGRWSLVAAGSADFFTLQNLALTWVVFIFVKTVHEFGHGLTCKHFGGEVHEMGILLIFLTPYLYCNVSDSWLLPDKHKRVLVAAAGILVECVLACLAAWLWFLTHPGLFNQICFNVMFICSISTILFNGNPLLKFDGYYILTDLVEVPNLKAKANAAVSSAAQRLLCGTQAGVGSSEISGPVLVLYAIVSYAYGLYVTFHISIYLSGVLSPFGLGFLSQSYVALFLFASVLLPCYRFARFMSTSGTLTAFSQRSFWTLGLLAALVAGVFLIPWQSSVKRSCVLQHAQEEPVSGRTDGFIRQVLVSEGSFVKKGEAIARLENLDLETARDDLALEKQGLEVAVRSAISSAEEAERLSAAAARRKESETEARLFHVERQMAEMELKAPTDGIVIGERLQDMTGRFLAKGAILCRIGSPGPFRAIISLDQQEAQRVQVGQKVEIRIRGFSDLLLQATISKRSEARLSEMTSQSAAAAMGGDTPAEPGENGLLKPSAEYYEAEAVVEGVPADLQSGMSGKARIYTGKTTLGIWLWGKILEAVDPGVRL